MFSSFRDLLKDPATLWPDVFPDLSAACAAAAEATGTSGAGVLIAGRNGLREPVGASDELSDRLDELALTVGEGPQLDACRTAAPVLAADLSSDDAMRRWPVFAASAADVGARALFSFPVRVGKVCVAALTLQRTRPGPVDAQQLATAVVFAEVAAVVLVNTYGADGTDGHAAPADPWGVVHTATGMLVFQLGVSVADAYARLRAYAYAHRQGLREVAHEVVARRLSFDRNGDPCPR